MLSLRGFNVKTANLKITWLIYKCVLQRKCERRSVPIYRSNSWAAHKWARYLYCDADFWYNSRMKIGIYDSGLGGLLIAKAIFKKLPCYNYLYLGDTKNLPYGQKTPAEIYHLTEKAVDFLYQNGCQLIIIACNTASALALRKIQQKYLPKHWHKKRVLGVIIPTLEEADKKHRGKTLAVIGTTATVKSHIYKKELQKIDGRARIFELATPGLVPLIEKNSLQKAAKLLQLYLQPLQNKGTEALVLACTHYPLLKSTAKKFVGPKVKVISQDDIIPDKLTDYLKRHPEIESLLGREMQKEFFVTSQSRHFNTIARRLFGKSVRFELAKLGR